MNLDPTEYNLRLRLKNDFPYYANECLKIRAKDGLKQLILNRPQIYLHNQLEEQRKDKGKIRAVILKSRQVGASTYIAGRFFHICTHKSGIRVFILTHQDKATDNLYEMVRRYYDNLPAFIKPMAGTHNAKELTFPDIDSGYRIGTAGSKAIGRSSTIQLFHWSEMAFSDYAEDHFAGIMQAIPSNSYSEAIIESTANGVENHFHYLWEMACEKNSEYKPIFLPWYWDEHNYRLIEGDFFITKEEEELRSLYSLTNEQVNFRRFKIQELSGAGRDGEKLFKQEFPSNAQEAFIATGGDSLINIDQVEKARRCDVEAIGPLVIGVDPAWEGKDSTAIIKRRGRKAYDLEEYQGMSPMQVVERVLDIIKRDSPDKIFVDIVGLGAGIIDRLRQLGFAHLVLPVNGGSTANSKELYVNKNAEMWALMAEWFNDEPVSIPDDLGLVQQLCSRSYSHRDVNHKLVLQSKKEMKKSPDKADALAMTFAFPIGSNASDWKMYYNPTIKI